MGELNTKEDPAQGSPRPTPPRRESERARGRERGWETKREREGGRERERGREKERGVDTGDLSVKRILLTLEP